MPEITGLVHHVNLSVSNLDRSADWYSQTFDLVEITRLTDPDGAWSKRVLRHDSGFLVGLTEHERNNGRPFDEASCGMDHFAFDVGNDEQLANWLDRLDELGIERSAIKATPLGKLITIRDPDNIQLELYAASRAE